MNILVTGATGFVGRHLVPQLLERGHCLTVVVRNEERARSFSWFERVRIDRCDIHTPIDAPFERFNRPDAVIHLAWPGLPNYKAAFHVESTLPAECRFLQSLITGGLRHLLVTGTCFEYGMQNGCLVETLASQPANTYAQAKDSLRRFLENLQDRHTFTLQWARLFYMYGAGQNPNSLLAQLDRAIDNRESVFNMSGGEQLRDYLPVEEVARRLALLVDHPDCTGIINICSGNPVSVLELVTRHIESRRANICLNRGYYPYSDHEPMAFWGNPEKFEKSIDPDGS